MTPYISYLVRLWQTNSAEHPIWRASLEDPRTGQRSLFASPEAAFQFLQKQIQPEPDEKIAAQADDWD
jgi:hypothetical protein